jgi:hypothetical protein
MKGVRPGGLYSLNSDGEGGLLHVLVLQPYGSALGANGGRFEVAWTSASEEIIWRREAERRLSFAYRLFPRRFEVGGQSWRLETSNVFVVRLDNDWRPSVEALPLQTDSTSSLAVLKSIQQALPQDAEIASLEVVQ